MVRFIAQRLIAGVTLLIVISTVAYLLMFLGSSNVARNLLGPTATTEQVSALEAQLGLDKPLLVRYWDWLSHAVTGDLGTSWSSRAPVTELVTSRVGVTLSLLIGAVVLTAIVAVLLGAWAASAGGWVDRVIQVSSVFVGAVPNFLVALVLVYVFALSLGWFQPTGYTPPEASVTAWLSAITLPVLALAVGSIAGVAQQVRGSMIDQLRKDYVRTLECRGLSARRILLRHVLRNSAGPALNVLAVLFVAMIGGAVVIEQIFAIPGLGSLTVSSSLSGDIPLTMGIVVTTVIIVVILNLLVDLVQAWLNPKVRLS